MAHFFEALDKIEIIEEILQIGHMRVIRDRMNLSDRFLGLGGLKIAGE